MSVGLRWTVSLLLAVGVMALLPLTRWQLAADERALAREHAISSAQAYLQALESFRTLYTANVVARIPRDHVEVTHDYGRIDGAIPLPATMTMELADHIGLQRGQLGAARLFSAYPFPWRKENHELDAFELAALAEFGERPQTHHYEFLEGDGNSTLRYAKADLMRLSCVQCHNTHVDSPKTDWKVGDVRGALSVSVVLPNGTDLDPMPGRVVFIGHGLVALCAFLGVHLVGTCAGRGRRGETRS